MASVLVVDDDAHIREVVRFALEQAGHQVIEAADGKAALDLIGQQRVDAIILDILMPGLDGLDACRQIRARCATPILFLSSRDDELDRVLGLELGADDYVTKPFSPRELVARVKAVLRRTDCVARPLTAAGSVKSGLLHMDLDRHSCTWNNVPVVLTVTEFELLQALAAAPGRVFTRDQLIDAAYGPEHVITERTVDSHIRRVRKKLAALGADPIETVLGLGYRWREQP